MGEADKKIKPCDNEAQKRLQEQLLRTDVRLAAYEQEFSYQRTLLYNPQFTPTQKVLLFILRDMMQSMRVNRLTLTQRTMECIERVTMLKQTKIRGCLRELKEQGAIQCELTMGPPALGKRDSQLVITFQTSTDSSIE